MSAEPPGLVWPRSETCAACRHWRALSGATGARAGVEGGAGECRARPPVQDFRWSRTAGGDWCGLFAPAVPAKPGKGSAAKAAR